MCNRKRIRFACETDKTCYFLKLGPMELNNPPEREFLGGEEVEVYLKGTPNKPGYVDLTFDDGQFALEVSKEYFTVIEDEAGR